MFWGLYQDVFCLGVVSSNNIIRFEAILSQADRSPNRAVMFIIQSRALKIYFLVFKKSVSEYDNQFINKFHQTCCIKLPEFRGHGTGTSLMNYLFGLLRERGYSRTSLSVQQDNPAVRFYKRLGYEITDEKLDHAGHGDYIMVKNL